MTQDCAIDDGYSEVFVTLGGARVTAQVASVPANGLSVLLSSAPATAFSVRDLDRFAKWLRGLEERIQHASASRAAADNFDLFEAPAML